MRFGSGAGGSGPHRLRHWHHKAAAGRHRAWHAHGEASASSFPDCRGRLACRLSKIFLHRWPPLAQEMLSIAQRLGPQVHAAIGKVLAEAMALG